MPQPQRLDARPAAGEDPLLAAILAEQRPDGAFPSWRAPPDDPSAARLDPARVEVVDSPFLHTYAVDALTALRPPDARPLEAALTWLEAQALPNPDGGPEWRFFPPQVAHILPDTDMLARALDALSAAGRAPTPSALAACRRRLDPHRAPTSVAHPADPARPLLAVRTWLGDRPDNELDPVVNANLLAAATQLGWTGPLVDELRAWLAHTLRSGAWRRSGASPYYLRPRTLPMILGRLHALDGSFHDVLDVLAAEATRPPDDALDAVMAAHLRAHLTGVPAVFPPALVHSLTHGPLFAFFQQRTPRLVYGSRALQCGLALAAAHPARRRRP